MWIRVTDDYGLDLTPVTSAAYESGELVFKRINGQGERVTIAETANPRYQIDQGKMALRLIQEIKNRNDPDIICKSVMEGKQTLMEAAREVCDE